MSSEYFSLIGTIVKEIVKVFNETGIMDLAKGLKTLAGMWK